jgi:hypothetical protein
VHPDRGQVRGQPLLQVPAYLGRQRRAAAGRAGQPARDVLSRGPVRFGAGHRALRRQSLVRVRRPAHPGGVARPEAERGRQQLADVEVQPDEEPVAGEIELYAEPRHLGHRIHGPLERLTHPVARLGIAEDPGGGAARDEHAGGHQGHLAARGQRGPVRPRLLRRPVLQLLDGRSEQRVRHDRPPDVVGRAGPELGRQRRRPRRGHGRRGDGRRGRARRRLEQVGRDRRQLHLGQRGGDLLRVHHRVDGVDRPELGLDLGIQVELVLALRRRLPADRFADGGRLQLRAVPLHRDVAGQRALHDGVAEVGPAAQGGQGAGARTAGERALDGAVGRAAGVGP